MFDSYRLFPVLELGFASMMGGESLMLELATATGTLFSILLRIIAPPLIVVMLLDLMLGIANRMAPQLDVFFISLSLKATLASLLVALSLTWMVHLADELFASHRVWMREATGLEGGLPQPSATPNPGLQNDAAPQAGTQDGVSQNDVSVTPSSMEAADDVR